MRKPTHLLTYLLSNRLDCLLLVIMTFTIPGLGMANNLEKSELEVIALTSLEKYDNSYNAIVSYSSESFGHTTASARYYDDVIKRRELVDGNWKIENDNSLAFDMKCRSPMNVSLGMDCELVVTPEMALTSSHDPAGAAYVVMIMDDNQNIIPDATFTYEHIGETFDIKVLNEDNDNSCWTRMTVEDKFPPTILCDPDTIEVECHAINAYTGPMVEDNCDPDVQLSVIDSSVVNLECDSNYISLITKVYIAEDKYGKVSQPCEQHIAVKRVELDSIKGPAGLVMREGTGLNCADYPDGVPGPEVTGVPTLDSIDIYPMDGKGFCNIVTTYRDEHVGDIGCTRKILRTWSVFEWHCDSTEVLEFEQLIEITDTVPPVILSELEDFAVSAGTGNCQASVLLPAIMTEDACNDDVSVIIKDRLNTNGGVVLLDEGIHEIVYIVSDRCGNIDSLNINVTVIDKSPPVAVCLDSTTVALDFFGNAYIPAENFDNGSHDACGIDSFEVRRMQDADVTCIDIPEEFGPAVDFCCDDAGKVRMVELRVWDTNGNSNTCMVEVEVQDKFPPRLTVPADQTITCGDDYDLEYLSEFGHFEVDDACGVTIDSIATDSISSCGTGRIERTYIVSDANGTVSGTQIIEIINNDPFVMNPEDWPMDFETDQLCGTSDFLPENLPVGFQRPTVENNLCSNASATYVDEKHSFPGEDSDACFKILRKWTVIDWCQEDSEGNPRKWTHQQIIKVSNNDKPTIVSDLSDVVVCSSTCDGGPIVLGARGMDTCTIAENLTWEYAIDYNDDGSVDSTLTGDGDTVTIDGMFPIGNHSVLWTFNDECGNRVSQRQLFTIEDCNGPVASAIDGFTVGLVPMDMEGNDGVPDTEMACIYADSVDASSYHPCDLPIFFSFSRDTSDKELCFNCHDLGKKMVYLYVTDIFGNVDSVFFMVDVQDNNDVDICQDPLDCVVFPADTSIAECIVDLSPEGLGIMPSVDPDCFCDDFTVGYTDEMLPGYGVDNCTFLRRTWTVTFNCGINPIVASQIQDIELFNMNPPTITCPPDMTVDAGDNREVEVMLDPAIATGSCNTGLIITNSFNSGGDNASGVFSVGITEIEFVAVDDCGNADTCVTTITIEGTCDFDIDDITFPADEVIFIDDCNDPIDPESLGSTTTIDTLNAACCDVSVDFEDMEISSGEACEDTIRRIWEVIATCLINGENMTRTWRDTQLIILLDTIAPVIIAPEDITITNNNPVADCSVDVDLNLADITDNCSEVGEITIINNGNGDTNSADASGAYLPGEYTIIYTATDKCGNMSTDSFTLTVGDPTGSIVNCNKIVVEIGDNETATRDPDDFADLVPSDCYDRDDLKLSFDRVNPDSTSAVYTCEDVGVTTSDNIFGITTPIYVFDMGMLIDSCDATAEVRNEFGNECGGNMANIIGNVATPAGNEVEGVTVELDAENDKSIMTNAEGVFAFDNLPFGSELTVKPYKMDDILNGVTTLDVIMIQRHILGLEALDNEYRLVAADIDHSMHISAADILSLRKTILGIYKEFPNNMSWRMVDAMYEFPEKANPFAEQWPEQYYVDYLTNGMNIDFVGVKIGDVSGDAIANSRDQLQPRNSFNEVLLVEKTPNGTLIKASEDMDLIGFQFATQIQGRNLIIDSDLEGFSDQNYAIDSEGLKISWNSLSKIEIEAGQTLMEIKGKGNVQNLLSNSIAPEVYLAEDEGVRTYKLILEKVDNAGLLVTSAQPNPWSEFTNISFDISYEDQVMVRFYDASGRQILQKRINANHGTNTLRVDKNELSAAGLIYYDIISSREKQQGKMIVIK